MVDTYCGGSNEIFDIDKNESIVDSIFEENGER